MVATIPAHKYIIGISVFGLFFLSHINDPNAARDIVNTCEQESGVSEGMKKTMKARYKVNANVYKSFRSPEPWGIMITS